MNEAILLIRIGVSLTMVLFGINQFLNPQKWIDYIPQAVRKMLFMSPDNTMRMHALGNVVIGIWFAVGIFPVAAEWVTLVWWISILPFAFIKFRRSVANLQGDRQIA